MLKRKLNKGIIKQLPSFPHKDVLNATPTLVQIKVATDKMKSAVTPGKNDIPAEVFKHGVEQLMGRLHQLIKTCLRHGNVSQDFKDVEIIPAFKKRGDYKD